jgi:hypothetical protein
MISSLALQHYFENKHHGLIHSCSFSLMKKNQKIKKVRMLQQG